MYPLQICENHHRESSKSIGGLLSGSEVIAFPGYTEITADNLIWNQHRVVLRLNTKPLSSGPQNQQGGVIENKNTNSLKDKTKAQCWRPNSIYLGSIAEAQVKWITKEYVTSRN